MNNEPVPAISWQSLQPAVWYANKLQCLPGFSFGPRVIDEHQFIFVAAGHGLAFIQGEPYNALPGSLFYYGPDTVHHFIADETAPFLLYGLHFSWEEHTASGKSPGIKIRDAAKFDPVQDSKQDNRMLVGNTEQPDECLLFQDVRQLSIERFEPRFARLAECYSAESRAYTAPLLRGLLLELLAAMKQEELRTSSSQQPLSPIIGAIAAKCGEHARERYNHNWLGQWSSYHPDHIARLFRAQLGTTPYDYFMSRKLELAKELLAHSELSLLAIADELQVGSIHNFTKWFKQHSGLPPGRFRKLSRFI
ncbi:AraC family transcriptional regulator [Paenibacillus lignilyticus]|uniref:AraC family transcriptional regulator n=1 Tax=Paenibacillus lignilyticus TaxID=1172615 RepID=A0ABS5CMK6_9BACL|nr:AraC family transcriptional regulator [Paenibacillus lignilyticus]MBP3967097.1 AraC family transcriptional regulator [Paenibacillus lignilyticus]